MPPKKRLDQILVEKGLAPSRQKGQALIMAARVLVNNQPVEKPGALVSSTDEIRLKQNPNPYASRGGLKLAAALEHFKVDASGCVCLDVGASTGGFTDCLLQHGAVHVYAVDVGYGQLAWKLRQDRRVTVIERMNIRHMPGHIIQKPIDIITIDVSFISLKIVIPGVLTFMQPTTLILALIKPQFEVGKGMVGKGGVVRDTVLHDQVITDISEFVQRNGLKSRPPIPSPIWGPKGNKEFMIYCSPDDSQE